MLGMHILQVSLISFCNYRLYKFALEKLMDRIAIEECLFRHELATSVLNDFDRNTIKSLQTC